ncbi:MAG: acyltransferase [Deltaproteobacteria bacterium]|nr:MAG: acyltransferase [Deltaproteobacteria bacterium]
MLSFLPDVVRGSLSLLLYVLNTFFWCVPLYFVAVLRLVLPLPFLKPVYEKLLIRISFAWIYCNNLNQDLFNKTRIVVSGLEGLKERGWYLVVSNHQTWVDILILQRVFFRRIPFLKFFLKKELIWVPVLGLAWWALDFPFMRRYSGKFLKKNPHLKGRDIEITKKACAKFATMPVSVMNFVEGTRFTKEKHSKQQSPHKNLLRPKAGGVAFVLESMGEHLKSIVDVIIVYPPGPRSFWDFLCGRIRKVVVDVETIPVTDELIGDYLGDEEFRARFQDWINTLWEKKDAKITRLLPLVEDKSSKASEDSTSASMDLEAN